MKRVIVVIGGLLLSSPAFAFNGQQQQVDPVDAAHFYCLQHPERSDPQSPWHDPCAANDAQRSARQSAEDATGLDVVRKATQGATQK